MAHVPEIKLNGPEEPESSQLRVEHLRALVEASKILNSTLDLDHLLGLILEVATRALKADRGTVYLLDKAAGELRARISQGLESRVLRVKVGEGISGKVAETGETVRIENAYQDSRFQKNSTPFRGIIRAAFCACRSGIRRRKSSVSSNC
ncbi:MAG: GAF domain-containing protein [Acidobacteria bacterium]|nr:GAF domain-containing protein [Acidobacteriota bacterium]